MYKILVIEDEDSIRDLIKMNLNMVGYETIEGKDGKEGLTLINSSSYDLCILDIMLPSMDGYELLPYLIKNQIPVILLTAKDRLSDRVKGLNMGADDYIVKPFEALELLARVQAVLRRAGKTINTKGFDDIEVHIEKHTVYKTGMEIELTPREFELLVLLLDNKGIALSRDKILERIWEYDYDGNTRTVDIHIQRLRKKLNTNKIKTVFKLGYRLED